MDDRILLLAINAENSIRNTHLGVFRNAWKSRFRYYPDFDDITLHYDELKYDAPVEYEYDGNRWRFVNGNLEVREHKRRWRRFVFAHHWRVIHTPLDYRNFEDGQAN